MAETAAEDKGCAPLDLVAGEVVMILLVTVVLREFVAVQFDFLRGEAKIQGEVARKLDAEIFRA